MLCALVPVTAMASCRTTASESFWSLRVHTAPQLNEASPMRSMSDC